MKAIRKNEDSNFIKLLIGKKKSELNENDSLLNVSLLSIFPNTFSIKDKIANISTNYSLGINDLSLNVSKDEYLIELLTNTDNFYVIENKKVYVFLKNFRS